MDVLEWKQNRSACN